jgi:hypothetical protein
MTKRRKDPPEDLPHIGWREWVSFPDLGIDAVKAKIDTGARSSAIHAIHIETFARDGEQWVRWDVHPVQRETEETVECEAPIHDRRDIRSSSGHDHTRIVVRESVCLGADTFTIDLTLARRDVMGFRLLLGREAIRQRFVVDPGRSYLRSDKPD